MEKELVALLQQYMTSWVNADKELFLSLLSSDIYLVECYGASYKGVEETKKWFEEWNRKGKVLAWNLYESYYDPDKDMLIATWEFHVQYPEENEPVFDGVTLMQATDGKIHRLFEYSMKHDLFRPYKD